MSSERQPRPLFDRFFKLMERMDTVSLSWWAETVDACRAALVESRALRLENPYGTGLSAEDVAERERQEKELARLSERFLHMREQYKFPNASRLTPAGVGLLKTQYSDRVCSYTAITAAEHEALIAQLPRAIEKGLRESLDRETVVLRYDALGRSAYYLVRRKGPGLTVWVWSDLGMEAAAQLLSTIVNMDEPMDESVALELVRQPTTE